MFNVLFLLYADFGNIADQLNSGAFERKFTLRMMWHYEQKCWWNIPRKALFLTLIS